MEEKSKKRSQKGRSILLFAISALSVLLLIILWNNIAPFLIDNDNIYLKTIASGEMTGKPEAHMYYMGIVSGSVISTFYSLTGNGIPWFGIFMCISFASLMTVILYKSLAATKKIWQAGIVYAIYILLFIGVFYRYFAKTQYTLATGFAASAALFLLFLLNEKDDRKEYLLKVLPFFFLSLWALGIRDKAFFMLIPFFGMVFVGKLIDVKNKAMLKKLFMSGAAFLLALLIGVSANRLAYSSDDWKEFREYTTASEDLFDYVGFPKYDHHKETYERMGITESSYNAITAHYNILMDSNVNKENFVELARISEAEKKALEPSFPVKFIDVLKTIVRYNLFEYQDRPLNIFVFFLYLFAIAIAIISKKYKALRDIGFIAVARMFDWIYLVWYGRFPFRVTQIIYIAEFVLLIAIILKYKMWEMKRKDKTILSPVFGIMLAGIVLITLRFGFPVMKKTYEEIKSFRTMSVCFTELEDYLQKHSENFYYFDMSHLYYMEDMFSFEEKPYENYVYMGSWMPNSPWYNDKLKEAGIEDVDEGLIENDNVYLIYQQVDFDTRDFLDHYFEEHFPGTQIETEDVFVSSNGFTYEILKPKRMSY